MSKFDNLTKAFDQSNQARDKDEDPSKFTQLDVVRQSLAIVRTVEKLKTQGIPIVKKAEMDYLLALRVLEKHNVDPSDPNLPPSPAPSPGPTPSTPDPKPQSSPTKRTPQNHPEEFKVALEFSRKTVSNVEELLQQGQPVPIKQMEEYEMCKKFIKKYT